jgi:protein-disulfide isomerase
MRILLAVIAVISLPLLATQTWAQDDLNAKQQAAVEEIVEKLLTDKKPEIIIKALEKIQLNKQREEESESVKAMQTHKDEIFNDPNSEVSQNPKGDVTIVEFYDYQCGYCKMVHGTLQQLFAEEKNVRYIHKNYPILGPASLTAAHAAVAATKQNKFDELHAALLGSKERLDDEGIMAIAKKVGLDVDKLKKDMNDEKVKAQVQKELALGQALGVRGTPMFIIGDKTFPGAIGLDQFKASIAEVRAQAKDSKKP